LKGNLQKRCPELVIQVCDVEEVDILKGRTSRMLQKEFPALKRRYWGRSRFLGRRLVMETWSTGNITDDMVQAYLEHHRRKGMITTQLLSWTRTLVRHQTPVHSLQGGLVYENIASSVSNFLSLIVQIIT
jgi:hypothetical protein